LLKDKSDQVGYRTPYEDYFKEQAGCHEPKTAAAF
jgi:hypothetical protein